MPTFPDGLLIVCKRDCETCNMVQPVYEQLKASPHSLTIYSQDDPAFPSKTAVFDDTLETSYQLNIEIVPTLIRIENGVEQSRTVGWNRTDWERVSGLSGLGLGLPDSKPGCGAINVEPGIAERLEVQFGNSGMVARQLEVPPLVDEMEIGYERGWSDGLPVVPPTPERVLRMLGGTHRAPSDIVGIVPPNQVACTVEKVAINAVLAGCKPEYLPVVLTAVSAMCTEAYGMHGVLATTYFSSPIIIVNGPIAEKIGMNSGGNALGQGNRANATIGRALQLVIRNVGGGKPQEIDRATLGTPAKYTLCFAEREHDSPWESLAVERGFDPTASTVTLFTGGGVQGMMDQLSREPESLAKSLADCLRVVCHPKLAMVADAMLVVSPEHARVFKNAGWTKARLRQELTKLLMLPGEEIIRGANGIAEGMPTQFANLTIPKFREGGLHIVHAGGTAGLFSAVIGGWPASGDRGSTAVTLEIE